MTKLTRRQLIGGTITGAAAVTLAGCGGGASTAAADGSTLISTWIDRTGDGQLQVGPGEPLVDRTRLGRPARLTGELARLVQLTDAHVMDASSPARVPFLARLGPPVQSTFRPQEALTAQVLHGAVNATRAQRAQLVIQGGDLIDNDQNNELEHALALLNGGRVHPGSGPDGYHGVQLPSDPDPFYYRPEIDAPRHPGLLTRAVRPFTSRGLGGDWLPVLGDHDALVQGELVPSAVTQNLATGDRALWDMPTNLRLPAGLKLSSGGSPDGPPDSSFVESFLQQALAGPTVRVPADHGRYELAFVEVIRRLWNGAGGTAQPLLSSATAASAAQRLDYVRDVGSALRVIVLDVVRRGGGSGGLVGGDQPAWLEQQLASAGDRWVIVVTHQPIEDSSGGEAVFAVLDRSPHVVAALAGHTHRNRIIPRVTATGGYWLITTCSLIDFPQQCRALRLYATESGGVAIRTWMLDHVGNGPLGPISRELSYLDAQGGRARHFRGTRLDRNATLFRRAAG
ncbi:MAG TPA: metallophosphoesterase [Solirubrobacteraceae bacterium]|jgi:3',5'-cyclic AMP phosphodiesterase CpdA|nr:metallophosphoesterase [Solirubrobacteraceae bacterium]